MRSLCNARLHVGRAARRHVGGGIVALAHTRSLPTVLRSLSGDRLVARRGRSLLAAAFDVHSRLF